MKRVVIAGGGWSGCAAAVEAAKLGAVSYTHLDVYKRQVCDLPLDFTAAAEAMYLYRDYFFRYVDLE